MKLKKRKHSESIYSKRYQWWLEHGTPDTRANKNLHRANRHTPGNWILVLLAQQPDTTDTKDTLD